MFEEVRERMKEEERDKRYVLTSEYDEECYLTDANVEGEHCASDTEIYYVDDSFCINENCPFYNLITEDFPVIDDGDENKPISHHTEKRPIAEYCDFINDYSFNCFGCIKNK